MNIETINHQPSYQNGQKDYLFCQACRTQQSEASDVLTEGQTKTDYSLLQFNQWNLDQFKVEKELYSNQDSKVVLVKNESGGKTKVAKITEIEKTNSSVSIHLMYQIQFYKKLNLASVSHLMKIINIWSSSTKCTRLMEYACRGDLTDNQIFYHLEMGQKMQHLKTVKNVLWQVVKGLEEVHSLGYAYRDLKPSNIVISHNGQILLCDFELVAPFGVIDDSICGTPQYIAPQRLSKKRFSTPIQSSVDMWSLGVLAFELLMGFTPYQYQQDNIEGLLESMYGGYLIFDTQYPPQCKNFIYNLLQTNPSKRLSTQKVKQHPFFRQVEQQPFITKRCKCLSGSYQV